MIWDEEDGKTGENLSIRIIRGLNGEAALIEDQEKIGEGTGTFSDA
jgi:hypothetical protein